MKSTCCPLSELISLPSLPSLLCLLGLTFRQGDVDSKELNGKARRNGAWSQRAWWRTPGLPGNWAGRLAAALLVIAKHQRPHKCPSAGGGYIFRLAHCMEYCVAVKMNDIELYVTHG